MLSLRQKFEDNFSKSKQAFDALFNVIFRGYLQCQLELREICQQKTVSKPREIVISGDGGEGATNGQLQGGKGGHIKMRLLF